MKQERRKNLIVSRLQLKMIYHCLGLVLVVSIILSVLSFLLFSQGQLLSGLNQWLKIVIFVIVAVVLYSISYLRFVKLSNKIYGPIYRLAGYLKKLSDGIETGEIKFRKDDVIDGIQDVYNELCHSLTKTLHYDYNELVNTFSQIEDILDRMHHKTITEEELYKSLENICGRLADALDLTTDVIHRYKDE
ncbi:MAG: hypothetical protein N3A65_08175 [candidate division WOR-3 bacterium]|nr:hypothetical protein [candidate division WOR-3 bacterium]